MLKILHVFVDIVDKFIKSRRKRAVGDHGQQKVLEQVGELIKLLGKNARFQESCYRNKTVICPRGQKGEKGDSGKAGPKGPLGPAGEKGQKGDTGVKGDMGVQGLSGFRGSKGQKGEKGYPGKTIEKPRITALSNPQTVVESSDVTFTCEAIGNPAPNIIWDFHGRNQSESRYSFPTATGMMIQNAQFNDTGNITCIAENILGKAEANTELIIWGK